MTITVENREIPVLLLTGYLGSGKTTLLNRILSNRKGIKFAVIVNDIGEVNIDADLIQKGGVVGQTDDSLIPLQNGCICCTLKLDLVNQINDLCKMNKFDYIVIEASGICEPAPIAQTICSIPQLLPEYARTSTPRLDAIVTVVDALRMKEEFASGEALERPGLEEDDLETLVIQQVEFCNIVLLNKASEVSSEDLGTLKGIIRALNPKAAIHECDYGDIDLDLILNTGLFDFDKVATSAAWISAIEGEEEEIHNEESGEALEYNISTYVYYRRPALDINMFDYVVSKKWPSNIIRAKGLCYFADEPDKCYLFEQSGSQKSIKDAGLWFATMPEDRLAEMMSRDRNLRRDWDPKYGDRMEKIVFIGRDLDTALIDELMDSCLTE
ncbi:MAG: GTP-binding protein [Bacteroidales bacterium]|nr:GTP-binding protein [Bacteroidales bacterium]